VRWLLGLRQPGPRIPPIFVLGVVMMVAVVGGLLLRSQLAAAGGLPSPAASGPAASGPTASGPAASGSALSGATPPTGTAVPSPAASPGATPSGPQAALSLTGYVWPVTGAFVTLPFGPSEWGEFIVDDARFHDGLDMATNCGDYVRAAHDGVVLAASREYDAYLGWTSDIAPYYKLLDTKHWWNSLPIVIVIDDGNGYRSIYAHEYQVIVHPGQQVKAGQVIGYEGATGNASGCHVHFGLFKVSETATFQLDPAIVAKDLMPPYETARVDPLLVLPFRCEVEETRTLRPIEAAPCPPLPTPTASAEPTATTSTAKPTGAAVTSPSPSASETVGPLSP